MMLSQMKKILTALLIGCIVLAISSIPISGITKGEHPNLYIYLNTQIKDKSFNLSERFSILENPSSIDHNPNLNFVDLVLRDFALLTNKQKEQHIKNHQKHYQKILESTKESLIESLKFNVDEKRETEKIQREIEEDAVDFLEELLTE